jgi:hypothetical protein
MEIERPAGASAGASAEQPPQQQPEQAPAGAEVAARPSDGAGASRDADMAPAPTQEQPAQQAQQGAGAGAAAAPTPALDDADVAGVPAGEAESYLVECVTYTARMLEQMLASTETARSAAQLFPFLVPLFANQASRSHSLGSSSPEEAALAWLPRLHQLAPARPRS